MKLTTTALVLLVSGTASAGAIQRPDGGLSARGVAMGGAWVAFADDATAIYFNPAALDAMDSQIMIGGELIFGPREYVPVADDGTRGESQDTMIFAPAPSLGLVGRFENGDRPSRITLGLGVFNTFGGDAAYKKTGMPALDVTRDLVIEIQGALAVHVSERFSVGVQARMGIGLFHVESTMLPFDADLSATGIGGGVGLGALLRPTDKLRIGLAWHSPMNVKTKGSGQFKFGGPQQTDAVEHVQHWPQWASLGLGYQASPRLKLAVQADWTQWSNTDEITVTFPAGALPDQIYPEYWRDSWAFRAGADYAVTPSFSVRAGTYYDQYAVPLRTLERQYLDANKVGLSAGVGFRVAAWRFDTAFEGIIPSTRTVENNAADVMNFTPLINKSPGDHRGTLMTVELAAARQF